MATTIITKNGTTGTPSGLADGELAVDRAAGKLWVGHAGGVTPIVGGPLEGGTVDGATLRWNNNTEVWEENANVTMPDPATFGGFQVVQTQGTNVGWTANIGRELDRGIEVYGPTGDRTPVLWAKDDPVGTIAQLNVNTDRWEIGSGGVIDSTPAVTFSTQAPESSLFLAASGDVGINNGTPGVKLDVVDGDGGASSPPAGGVAAFRSNAAAGDDASISILSGNTGAATLYLGDTDGDERGSITYNNDTDSMVLATAGAGRLGISALGNFNFGGSPPSACKVLMYTAENNGNILQLSSGPNSARINIGTSNSNGAGGAQTWNYGEPYAEAICFGQTNNNGSVTTTRQHAAIWTDDVAGFGRADMVLGAKQQSGDNEPQEIMRLSKLGTVNISTVPSWNRSNGSVPLNVVVESLNGDADSAKCINLRDTSQRSDFNDQDSTSIQFWSDDTSSTGTTVARERARIACGLKSNGFAGFLKFYTGNGDSLGVDEAMRIDETGNLLVGKTSTSTSVLGVVMDPSGNSSFVAPTGTVGCFFVRQEAAAGADVVNFRSNFNGTNTECARLRVDGTLQTASDASLKDSVATLTKGLDTVLSLNPVSFRWINSGENDIGFIAQEVEAVVPEATGRNDADLMTMAKDKLVPVLVKAIQEQQALLVELTTRLEALESA